MTQDRASGMFAFASSSNAAYIESLYMDYQRDPESVDLSWRHFFAGYEFGARMGEGASDIASAAQGFASEGSAGEARVEAYINAYRRLGYLSADLNPLAPRTDIREDLKPEAHGLGSVDRSSRFHPSNLHIDGPATFDEIVRLLKDTYCDKIGPDYRDINDIEAVVWLQQQMEGCRNAPELGREKRLRILDKLTEAEGFERFLQDRYLGQKRFSIEGLDALIPLLDTIAQESAALGVEEINLGMAHRGRLNVLANFIGKDYEEILKEFEGTEYNPLNIEGDVKYHKGFANEITTATGGKIRVYLSPNPSHLEAVNPVLEGFTRARQRVIAANDRMRIVPILIHGDAAVAGQGVVAETLNFAGLDAYATGGTIHIIANNQLGFTANPDETMSCMFASDIMKFIKAPVLHVNADHPEAVVWAAQLAVAYRQRFGRDVVIDLIGYRRHGHNETDEPSFTQPLMYKVIKEHPSVLRLYGESLAAAGIVTAEEVEQRSKAFRARLQEGLLSVREGRYQTKARTPEELKESTRYTEASYEDIWAPVKTTVDGGKLAAIAERILSFPDQFTPHPKIVKLFEARAQMMTGEGQVDWGMAELLAYGSIALEGYHVRLSGQDCGRGTFSHRHAVLRDFNSGTSHNIFRRLGAEAADVDVVNSPLSESGCLGFEFGYSVADKKALVLWEAQFGDFVNGAQIIIDQFLVASEAKWRQTSSLVLLLPHGYEGQGPEHSSGRPERFLQLCGNQNIQVVNLTTPAQIFHLLRRQALRRFQKPLVVMTPKSLLRHPLAISTLKEFSEGGFRVIMDDALVGDPTRVKKVILCSGKIYYDLLDCRQKNEDQCQAIAMIRLEQLYPFPNDAIAEIMTRYPNAKEIVWTQEEPVNMGAWTFVRPRLEKIAPGRSIAYVGRRGSGSTAEGSLKSHLNEENRIVQEALGLTRPLRPTRRKKVATT